MSNSSELNSYIARLRQRLRAGCLATGRSHLHRHCACCHRRAGAGAQPSRISRTRRYGGAIGDRCWLCRRSDLRPRFAARCSLTRARAVAHAEAANPDLEQRLTTFAGTRKPEEPVHSLNCSLPIRCLRTNKQNPSVLVPDNRLVRVRRRGAGLHRRACLDDCCRPGFSRLWRVTALDRTEEKRSSALFDHRHARQHHGAAEQRSAYRRACHRHAARQSPALRALPERGRMGTCRHAAVAGCGSGANYQFVLAGLPENVEYYVAAGPLVSPHYKVHVVDLPSVKEIQRYLSLSAMDRIEAGDGGALRAIFAPLKVPMRRSKSRWTGP